jgi:GrpB-like predicted nucleotidyltransferase (UPF0157 family)
VDSSLAGRLRAVGVEPDAIADPDDAWRSLHEAYGTRATLLDRYVLESVALGSSVDELPQELRERLTQEVLAAHFPGFEIVGGADRHSQDPVEVVAYDPAWPDRFASWRDKLAAELGSAALRIDHIGSTSVPDLPAKPVIDIQVSVADIVDEESYVPHIERTGIAFRARDDVHRYFRPAGERPRDVQVHVCGIGSEWESRHLLFRDFLRADAATRAAYAALKRELATRYRDDRIAYNEAKTNFILDTVERAQAWRTRRIEADQ